MNSNLRTLFAGMLLLLTASPLTSQHRVWRIDAPAAGPFMEMIAVIGDRDSDGHADIVRLVFIHGSPPSAFAWSFSGRTGQVLTMGPNGGGVLFTAGDVDGDGCGDYIIQAPAAPWPACAPQHCRGYEARSGRDDRVLWHAEVPGATSLGHMVAGDLDLDGDGRPDALIGTNYNFGLLYAINARGQLLYQITGSPTEPFGAGVGKFYDYDGDGCDDFLLGCYLPPHGAADIRSGRDGSLLRRLVGPPSITRYGSTVAMIGDQDGDGLPDVVVGDSGPFSPGVLTVRGSHSGAALHQWQVNAFGGDDFGWPWVATADVDRDGFDDLIANARNGNVGQYIFSGRDGSLIEHYHQLNDALAGPVEAMPPQGDDPFPRYVCHGGSTTVVGMSLFSGAPQGVERIGAGSAGTLPRLPTLGVRELLPNGFRVTLSGTEPGAFALLLLGIAQPTLPLFDLSGLGFPGARLFVQLDLVGFFQTGAIWPDAGYVAHDFPHSLVSAATLQALAVDLQWIAFQPGAGLAGGVSDAMRLRLQ